MSEQAQGDVPVESPEDPFEDLGEAPVADDPVSGPVATGHPAVDEVLRSLDGIDGRPVDEHVAAFEEAHDVLRRALSDAGDDQV